MPREFVDALVFAAGKPVLVVPIAGHLNDVGLRLLHGLERIPRRLAEHGRSVFRNRAPRAAREHHERSSPFPASPARSRKNLSSLRRIVNRAFATLTEAHIRTSSTAMCATAALFVVTTVAAQIGSAPAGSTTSPTQGGSLTQGSTSKAQGAKRSMHIRQGQTRKQTFDRLGINHDGVISREEAQGDPDLIIIFADADADEDRQLSFAEFIVVPITQEDGSAVG